MASPITNIGEANMRDRVTNIGNILKAAPRGKIYLMPYNHNYHWILSALDPWDDHVYYFDPLKGRKISSDFEKMIIS